LVTGLFDSAQMGEAAYGCGGVVDQLTTTIKREFLREIVAGGKKIVYRELKPFGKERRDADVCSGHAESARLS
jgi:hypothetical protein